MSSRTFDSIDEAGAFAMFMTRLTGQDMVILPQGLAWMVHADVGQRAMLESMKELTEGLLRKNAK